jgi:tripartite-type tricarboxylate transporter receptor subunit TctC
LTAAAPERRKPEDHVRLIRHAGWLAATFAVICAWGSAAQAQVYPSKIVRLVVAFPPGGPTDFVARLLADKLKTILGQTVLVENKGGANGVLGADYVAKSEPDGHTLFLTNTGAVAITPGMRTDMPYQTLRDFTPITLVVRNTTILVVRPDHPAASAKELAAMAKAKPATIAFASTGVGSMPHLALELYQASGGVKFLHVPYRGAAQAITDVLGGQVQALFADTPALMGQITGGRMRAIGAASDKRSEVLPNIPTLAEQGFPDTHADNWYGLLAPARTPPAVIAKIHDAFTKALNDPELHRKLLDSGAVPIPSSQEEFAALLRSELTRWGRVVKEHGIKEE